MNLGDLALAFYGLLVGFALGCAATASAVLGSARWRDTHGE